MDRKRTIKLAGEHRVVIEALNSILAVVKLTRFISTTYSKLRAEFSPQITAASCRSPLQREASQANIECE